MDGVDLSKATRRPFALDSNGFFKLSLIARIFGAPIPSAHLKKRGQTSGVPSVAMLVVVAFVTVPTPASAQAIGVTVATSSGAPSAPEDSNACIIDRFISEDVPPIPADASISLVVRGVLHTYPHASLLSDEYRIQEHGHAFKVFLPAGRSSAWGDSVLHRLAALFSLLPDQNQGALHLVEIYPTGNPHDVVTAKEKHVPGFKSTATGGNGRITFYQGDKFVRRKTFLHESAHNVAGKRIDRNHVTPEWKEAVRLDKGFVSSYAQQSVRLGIFGEDYAESYRAFREAQMAGGFEFDEFMRRFPHRAQLLIHDMFGRR